MSPEVHDPGRRAEPATGVTKDNADAGRAGALRHNGAPVPGAAPDPTASSDGAPKHAASESGAPAADGPIDADGPANAGPADTGAPANAGPAGPADTGAPAAGSLEAVRRERDEYLDMVRRVQADFENYKKRTVRQQSDQLDRAVESLVAKLLPALDAFDLTRAHLSDADDASPDVKALLQASALVADALDKEGLERIDEVGAAFDPTIHDAVEHAPAADDDTDPSAGNDDASSVVSDVLRTGYRWKGRVIRPAMVRVRG